MVDSSPQTPPFLSPYTLYSETPESPVETCLGIVVCTFSAGILNESHIKEVYFSKVFTYTADINSTYDLHLQESDICYYRFKLVQHLVLTQEIRTVSVHPRANIDVTLIPFSIFLSV